MTRFLVRRAAASLLLLWVVLSATFVLLQLAPGDPVQRYADPRVPPAQSEQLRAVYGLDRSLPVQYAAWLGAWAQGEWGVSFLYRQPVRAVVAERLGATLLLGLAAFVVQFGVGTALGIVSARRPAGGRDAALRVGLLTLYSMPSFWLGIVLILVASRLVPGLPSAGLRSPLLDDAGILVVAADVGRHLILPAVALGLPLAAPVARILRASLIEELGQRYVVAARARGLGEGRVLLQALRPALRPLIQLAGLSLPALLGGSVVIETVFSWPGLGSAAFLAIDARDYPLVLALTAVGALLVLAGSLLADLTQAAVDPRVAVER